MNDPKHSRREFLKWSGMTALVSAPIFAALKSQAAAEAKAADAKKPEAGASKLVVLEETDPTAKALGYVKKAEKADVAKFPKRATPEAKKEQFCKTCQFYTLVEGTGDAALGKCTLFMAPTVRHVLAGGWCNSWLKKG